MEVASGIGMGARVERSMEADASKEVLNPMPIKRRDPTDKSAIEQRLPPASIRIMSRSPCQ
jgi:hypothetical protein